MNKICLFLALAGVTVSASASDRDLLVKRNVELAAEPAVNVMAPFEASRQIAPVSILSNYNKKYIRKADEVEAVDFAYFRAASNIGMFGMSAVKGSGYIGVGFASAYGNLDFKNLSSNAKTSTWTFAEVGDYEVVGTGNNQTLNWHTKTSQEENLSIKSKLGEVLAPSLAVEFNSGKKGNCLLTALTGICHIAPAFARDKQLLSKFLVLLDQKYPIFKIRTAPCARCGNRCQDRKSVV